MIKTLKIKNIGGIHEADLNFTEGFNVITGESGAGKSSVVRALELLAGRAKGAKFIRAGEDKGIVEAEFEDKVILREVSKNGRAKNKINGENSNLTETSNLVNSLVKIQSQFAQIELLEPQRQLEMLDSCLPEEIRNKTFNDFREIYDKAKISTNDLRSIKKRRSEIEKQYSNAREIFELVKIAKPESGLEMKLENLLSDITHRISKREKAKESFDALTGGLSENGLIGNSETCFEELYDFMNENEINKIRTSFETLYDALKNLSDELDDDENDIKLRDETETRLGALRRLKRLCNIPDENELLNYCDEIYKNLEWLESSYEELKELSERALNEKKKANALAMEIRKARHETAEILQKRVNSVLNELAMTGINFKINFNGLQKLNRNGADEIEFIFDDGIRSGRVEKIASGGELSRLLLALQLSLPDEWLGRTSTIIFDEVEAGLGGRAAVLSGIQLKKLSQKCQVILVTHEASIAALGNSHILIQREKGETFMKNINGEERVKEIARMLSGSPNLTEAKEHARILINFKEY